MEANGSAIATIPEFVKENFGNRGFEKWLMSLSSEARSVYQQQILPDAWFPLKQTLTEPTRKICELFYDGAINGAHELGRFNADKALKGQFGIFAKLHSPETVAKRAGLLLQSYYRPCKMETFKLIKGESVFRIIEFPEIDTVIEERIAGWIERAIEISGGRNSKVIVSANMGKNNPYGEIIASWDTYDNKSARTANPDIKWKNIAGKECLYFKFTGTFFESQAKLAAEQCKTIFAQKQGSKIKVVWDCLEMKNYDKESRQLWQDILVDLSGQIECIWLINKSLVINIGANIISTFTRLKINVASSEDQIKFE